MSQTEVAAFVFSLSLYILFSSKTTYIRLLRLNTSAASSILDPQKIENSTNAKIVKISLILHELTVVVPDACALYMYHKTEPILVLQHYFQ